MKCRLCLIECHERNSVPLFNNGEETNLTKLTAKYLYIEITQFDALSTMMCKDCVQHLNEFHKFFQYVEQQQQKLQNEFLEIKCVMVEKPFTVIPEIESVKSDLEHNDESLLDIKDVINEDETCLDRSDSIDEFGYADENFGTLAEKETESEEDVPLQTLLSKAKLETHNNNKLTKKAPSTRVRDKKLICVKGKAKRKYQSRKRKVGRETSVDELKNNAENSIKKSAKVEDKKNKSKNYLTPDENKSRDEMVAKYVDLKCEICNAQVESYEALKVHFRKEHNRKAYITCCNTRFLRRFLLLEHIQSHLNPERFKCNLCGKVLKSKNNLNIHNKNMHASRENLKHECSLCNKRFQHLSALNHHMVVHNEGRDHICGECKKGFKSSVILKFHIQHMHGERTIFVCETCGKEYRFKMSFDRHVAQHQGRHISDPTDKCSICGKWYTLENLRKHLKRHELEESKCEECGKIYKTKSSLTSHIAYIHKMKQVHSCTLCGKTFKKPMLLREHMAMHTGRKDYSCPHCTREFRSKANMYVHVKKIHVEEWTKTQIARNQGPTEREDK